jgi:hypothetical protein
MIIINQNCGSRAIALMLEAAGTSETLINLYQTTRRNNPEERHLLPRRSENLKSHLALYCRIVNLPGSELAVQLSGH